MNIIIPYFVVMLIAGFFSRYVYAGEESEIGPYDEKRKSNLTAIVLIIIVLSVFAGFRHITASAIDESIYRHRLNVYRRMPLFTVLRGTATPLFEGILWLSNKIYPNNQGGILITALVNTILIVISFRRDCKDFSFAIMLYFVTECFYDSFNGIAQCLAAAVFLYGIQYAYNRQFWKFFATIVIATLIHSASIVLLAIYFIATSQPTAKKTLLFEIIMAGVMVYCYRNLSEIITRFGILTDYYGLEKTGHHGVNILTILISIAPAILVFYVSNVLPEDDRITTVAANITVINAVIMTVSSLDVYIARLCLFTSLFPIIFLSRVSLYLTEKNNLLKPVVFFLYAVVFYARYHSGVLYFFTP